MRAGAFVRGVSRPADPAAWTVKGARDFVTDVDRTAETIISEILLDGVPGSRIVGEEHSPELTTEGIVWVVDPLDGTTNFLHDFPWYAVSIAAVVDGVLTAAAVLEIPRNLLYTATRGGGAWCGAQRLAVSAVTDPSFALIGTGFPFKDVEPLKAYAAEFAIVAGSTSGIRRAGAAALDLVDVAAGRFEAFWEHRLSAWDVAAGALIVREAGGVITDFSGRDVGVEHGPVVAGNPVMHRWLLDIVQRGRARPP
ncbi:MAG: inositol monophosphatase [Gemmatimonadales bacterium]|nr:inositol monophosphatase [Gemmatimonadales bacterium]